jgi:hypothetical protein
MRKLKLAWRRDFKLRPVTSITLYRLTIDISSIHSRPLHVCAFTQLFTHIFYLSNCSPGLVLRSPRRSTSRSSTAAHNRPARRTPLGAPGRTRRKYRVRRRTRTATVGYTWLSDGAALKAHEDQGAGVSTRVVKEGQWRGASEVVVMMVRITVL